VAGHWMLVDTLVAGLWKPRTSECQPAARNQQPETSSQWQEASD